MTVANASSAARTEILRRIRVAKGGTSDAVTAGAAWGQVDRDYKRAAALEPEALIELLEDRLRDYDVLLCASSMDPSSRMDDADETARTYPRQARTPFNVTGHPALAMMAGLSHGGLPVSVQFVGRYFDDATVLRVAAAYERAVGWHQKRPPIG